MTVWSKMSWWSFPCKKRCWLSRRCSTYTQSANTSIIDFSLANYLYQARVTTTKVKNQQQLLRMSPGISSYPIMMSSWLVGLVELWQQLLEKTNVNVQACPTTQYSVVCMLKVHDIIGASLSEPHTSVNSLRTCACMLACLHACLLGPTTYRKF